MFSIGTDIVEVNRIRRLSKDKKFLRKVFSNKEIEYCNTYSDSHVHLSGKYAGKEAVKKALLSKAIVDNISLINIEILNKNDKSPYVVINGISNIKCLISISHEGEYAIAFVLIEE